MSPSDQSAVISKESSLPEKSVTSPVLSKFKLKLKLWLFWFGGGVVGYLFFCQVFFITHAFGGLLTTLSRLIFIPAACVRGEMVSYYQVAELAQGLHAVNDANKKEAFNQALVARVQQAYLFSLADELQVQVNSAEVDEYWQAHPNLTSKLLTAGWTEAEYKEFILEPWFLAQVTDQAVGQSKDYQVEALDNMESLRRKLGQGMPFGDVAVNFSEDPSAVSYGDLGILSFDDIPTWLQPALALKAGEVSPVLESPEALWTVTLLESYPLGSEEPTAFHFRGFAIKKRGLDDVLKTIKAENPAWVNVW